MSITDESEVLGIIKRATFLAGYGTEAENLAVAWLIVAKLREAGFTISQEGGNLETIRILRIALGVRNRTISDLEQVIQRLQGSEL